MRLNKAARKALAKQQIDEEVLAVTQLGATVGLAKAERDQKLADARHHGARTELHLFDLTFRQTWARLEKRNRDLPAGAVQIDPATFERIWDRFEEPDRFELARFDHHEVHCEGGTELPATKSR